MKLGKRVVVTDFGEHVISERTEQAYVLAHGKKRAGKYTRTSLKRAAEALASDVSAVVRLCWLTNRDVPGGLL
jgi:hypothetical protein